MAFYCQHNPAKLSEVDTLLDKWAGREEELFSKLEAKRAVLLQDVFVPLSGGPCRSRSS